MSTSDPSLMDDNFLIDEIKRLAQIIVQYQTKVKVMNVENVELRETIAELQREIIILENALENLRDYQ